MKRLNIASLALAVLLVSPVMADDAVKEKKKNARGNRGASPAMQLIKQLEPVGLTEEQTAKIKEMGKESMGMMKKLREDSGLTAELVKKRAEAQKAIKDSGKKGKGMAAAINEKAGLTEAQAAAFAKVAQARTKFQTAVVAMLTDEQKAKVPAKMQRFLKTAGDKKGKGKGKGKKKKEAAE